MANPFGTDSFLVLSPGTRMEGTYLSNLDYRNARDAFLLGNEGFRTKVYFDTVGVPTVGAGIALLVRTDARVPAGQPRTFGLH
jgi:hypothetical protein